MYSYYKESSPGKLGENRKMQTYIERYWTLTSWKIILFIRKINLYIENLLLLRRTQFSLEPCKIKLTIFLTERLVTVSSIWRNLFRHEAIISTSSTNHFYFVNSKKCFISQDLCSIMMFSIKLLFAKHDLGTEDCNFISTNRTFQCTLVN